MSEELRIKCYTGIEKTLQMENTKEIKTEKRKQKIWSAYTDGRSSSVHTTSCPLLGQAPAGPGLDERGVQWGAPVQPKQLPVAALVYVDRVHPCAPMCRELCFGQSATSTEYSWENRQAKIVNITEEDPKKRIPEFE